VTDAATPGDERDERDTPPVGDDIDLDAIEADLDRVERALDELAEGTYWQGGAQAGSADPSDPSTTGGVHR
jgi:hypothetical protein